METANLVMKEKGVKIDYLYGTMIEVPRAAVTADEIAETAEFFSFGTNDLTQMTFGFSRDDVNSFLPDYLKKEILERDPFQSLDTVGVGQLIEMAVRKGRAYAQGPEVRHLRRTWRRSEERSLLPQGWIGLCELLAISRADRAIGGGACGDCCERQAG